MNDEPEKTQLTDAEKAIASRVAGYWVQIDEMALLISRESPAKMHTVEQSLEDLRLRILDTVFQIEAVRRENNLLRQELRNKGP